MTTPTQYKPPDPRHWEGDYHPDTPSGRAYARGLEDGVNVGRWVVTAETTPQWCAEFITANWADGTGAPDCSEVTPALLAELAELSDRPQGDPLFHQVHSGYEEGWCDGWRGAVWGACQARIGADRPLLIGDRADPLVVAVRELAAEAGVQLTEFADPANRGDGLNPARWEFAPLVLVASDSAKAVATNVTEATLAKPRPHGRVALVIADGSEVEPVVWMYAVRMGAEHVACLPTAREWLRLALLEAAQ